MCVCTLSIVTLNIRMTEGRFYTTKIEIEMSDGTRSLSGTVPVYLDYPIGRLAKCWEHVSTALRFLIRRDEFELQSALHYDSDIFSGHWPVRVAEFTPRKGRAQFAVTRAG